MTFNRGDWLQTLSHSGLVRNIQQLGLSQEYKDSTIGEIGKWLKWDLGLSMLDSCEVEEVFLAANTLWAYKCLMGIQAANVERLSDYLPSWELYWQHFSLSSKNLGFVFNFFRINKNAMSFSVQNLVEISLIPIQTFTYL